MRPYRIRCLAYAGVRDELRLQTIRVALACPDAGKLPFLLGLQVMNELVEKNVIVHSKLEIFREETERTAAAATAVLGQAGFAAAYAMGQSRPIDDAVEETLTWLAEESGD